MKFKRLFCLVLSALTLGSSLPAAADDDTPDVIIRVNTESDKTEISPYIYGADYDSDISGVTIHSMYIGGSEYTAYDWESNFSNNGDAGGNRNGTSLLGDLSGSETPAYVIDEFVKKAASGGAGYTVAMLQNGEYVASGGYYGSVLKPTDESHYGWNRLFFHKGSELLLTPDKADGAAYIDEYVNYLVSKYGRADTTSGINAYTFGSNSDRMSEDFSYIRSEDPSCEEIVNSSIEFALAVKSIDPQAEVFGPSFSNFEALYRREYESEWAAGGNGYRWFLDYYLDRLKNASSEERTRLLDCLDIHYMSENSTAECVGVWECNDITHGDCNEKRIQAPRTLWDSTFAETSNIGANMRYFLPLIPSVQASINAYYPGTRLTFSEYSFGGGNHISGGLAVADALGIFGANGVYMASVADMTSEDVYIKSALNLYTDYDGAGSSFGRYSVKADCSDPSLASAYASVSDRSSSTLKIVLINKSAEECRMNVYVNTDADYNSLSSYVFSEGSPEITLSKGIAELVSPNFGYVVAPRSAVMVVLSSESGEIIQTEGPSTEESSPENSGDIGAETGTPIVSEITSVTEETTTAVILPETTESSTESESEQSGSAAIEIPPGGDPSAPAPVKAAAVIFGVLLAGALIILFKPEWSRFTGKKK